MNALSSLPSVRTIRHAHLFCGLGAGAKGFNLAKARVGNVVAKYVCTGGIDVDPGAIRNFNKLTGTLGTVMDLAARDQYIAFHGREPSADWKEATPADVRGALTKLDGVRPDIVFLSAPCKGFSGLLSSKQSGTDKYQALNGLTLRGVWLMCEAFKDDPIPCVLFENVPRIMTRGRGLLDQICAILRSYGYNVAETVHDCGELGGLAQSRKRFLLIARQREIIPNFIYEPEKKRLRGVGEVIGKLPLPGDPLAGVMHRVPMLQWKTWVRLAFVPAGKDWRALNELRVEDGVLTDFGIAPDRELRDGALGVMRWGDSAGVVVGNQRSPLHGRHSVADPRPIRNVALGHDYLGVRTWSDASGAITSRGGATNGGYSVADPRPGYGGATHHNVLGVNAWHSSTGVISTSSRSTSGANAVADPRPNKMMSGGLGVVGYYDRSGVIGGETMPTNGAYAVADVRPTQANQSYSHYGVLPWVNFSGALSGQSGPGGGAFSVQDPRLSGKPRFNNTFRIVRFDSATPAVAGPGGPAGGHAVADPRPAPKDYTTTKYKVTPFLGSSRAVIGASTTGDGAFAVADPRGPIVTDAENRGRAYGKYPVSVWIGPAGAVIAGNANGAYAVADPRVSWGNGRHETVMRITPYSSASGTVPGAVHSITGGQPCVADARRESYQTCGHYGVVGWGTFSGTISATLGHDNGPGNVADPRDVDLDADPVVLPAANDRLVCRIVSLDDTWHRPFTTLELAALQSIVDPEEAFYQDDGGAWHARLPFDLESKSDAEKREWIGNAVPSDSAAEIGSVIGEAILLAELGETFTLSAKTIWVSPARLALAVDTDQVAFEMDAQ